MLKLLQISVFCFLFFFVKDLQATSLILRENLKLAKPGDYLVAAQGKCYTVLDIREKTVSTLLIEETSIPFSQADRLVKSWKAWIESGAPGNTSWVTYEIDLNSGQMLQFFSFTRNEWGQLSQADNFLSALLNLELSLVPSERRKRIGPITPHQINDTRKIWQPKMVVEGQLIPNVTFDAFITYWPKDGSELSGKMIEIYLPQERFKYLSYFPYWLQISGVVGKANVRIIDSGSGLKSPKAILSKPQKV